MNILRKNINEIKHINFINTPKICTYKNDTIEIVYKNGTTQLLTHKNNNPNDLNRYDFDTNEDLLSFYRE